jgi:hypothetical protein
MVRKEYGREEKIKRFTKEITECRDQEKWKECRKKRRKMGLPEDESRTFLRNIDNYLPGYRTYRKIVATVLNAVRNPNLKTTESCRCISLCQQV